MLAPVIDKFKLEDEESQALYSTFDAFLEAADGWKDRAKGIVVKSADDKIAIKAAREARLEIRKVRIAVENRRVELKAESLRKGQAIDACANFIKGFIEPLEAHLQEQEDFAERERQKQINELAAKRQEEILSIMPGYELPLNIGGLDQDVYDKFIATIKAEAQQKKADEAAALEREKQRAAEEKRIREENEKLRLENEKKMKAMEQQQKKIKELERTAGLAKAAAEKKKKEDHQKMLDEEMERQRLEHEKESAPDREKLAALAVDVNAVPMPVCTTTEGKKAVAEAVRMLNDVVKFLKEKSLKL